MLIAVVASKGGVAKTTTAVHLAAALASKRGAGRVVLIDGDATRAATGWAHRGAGRLPFEVVAPGTPTRDAAHVVVDTAANEAAGDLEALAKRADVVIVPTPPYALDLAATLATVAALSPHGRVRVLLTRTPPAPQRDALEARAMLEARGVHVLRTEVPQRKPYAEAALIGGTVRDAPRGAELWPLWPRLIREVTP